MNRSLLAVAVFVLSGCLTACIGTSETPVLYISPDSTTIYTTVTFSPVVEFPDGIPDQGDVVIRINGIDVTAEFDLWDDNGDDKAGISARVDSGAYPLMLASFREGANTFQVTVPSKNLSYFNMNLGGANTHITEVVDSYCGTVFLNSVGDAADIADGTVSDFDCSGFVRQKCVHATYFTGNDNLGNPTYSSPYVNECEFAKGIGPAVPTYGNTRIAGKSMYVRGYFESTVPMDSMVVDMYDISDNSSPPAGAWSLSQTSGTVDHDSTDWSSGSHYIHFGTSSVNCNGDTIDLAVNEFCMVVPDPHGLRISSIDENGSSVTEWIRSDIQQTDERLGNGGVMALRGEVTALTEILDVLAKSLSTGDDLITGTEYLINPSDSPPGFCIGCKSMSMTLTELYLKEFKMTSDFPTPGSSNGRGGTWPSGQLNLFVDLDSASSWGVEAGGNISIACNGVTIFGIFIPNPICAIFASVNGPFSLDTDMTTTAEVVIALDGAYEMHTTTVLQGFDVKGIDLSVSGAIGGLIGFITPLIVDMLEGMLSDMIGGMVEGLVNAVFNKDIPLMRLVLPSVNTEAEAVKVYMALGPQMAEFTTNVNVYDDDVAGELAFGLHATGKPRVNQSIGSLYDSSAPVGLYQVSTARDDDVSQYSDRNVGFVLHESFVNQLMMGLWESGILYIDFNAGNDPLVNTFIDDADIRFASASPWTISHLADVVLGDGTKENAKGDVKLNVDDLVIHFSGDVYDPFEQKWYFDRIFFEIVIELEAYAQLVAEDGAFKVVFSSNPTIEMLSFYSDYIAMDATLGNSLLQQVVPMLVTNVGSFEFALPSLLGVNLDVGDVWIPDTANLAFTLDAFYEGPSYREYINRWSGECLTLSSGTSNGVNIITSPCVDVDEQKWGFDPVTGFMHSFANEDFCMVHVADDPTNRTLELWDCSISRPMSFRGNAIHSSALSSQVVEQNTGNGNAEFTAENGNDEQLWDLGKEGLVFHSLVENLTGLCLDADVVPTIGQNVYVWGCHGASFQTWAFEKSTGLIHNKDFPNLCIDHSGVDSNVVIGDCATAAMFKWQGGVFKSVDDGSQVLTSQGYVNGSNVNMAVRVSGAKNQVWTKEPKPLTYVEFVNDETGECMHVDGGVAVNGADVVIEECSTVAYGSPTAFNLGSGTFSMVNSANSYGTLASLHNGADDSNGASFHGARGSSGDWGIAVDLNSTNTVTQVSFNGRNDCCSNRMNGVVARLYNGGSLVHTSAAVSGAGTGISNIIIPTVIADEIRLVFPNTNGGANDGWMNFSELYVTVNNTLPSAEAQQWALNPFNGSMHSKLDPAYCASHPTGVPANGRNMELALCDPLSDNLSYSNETIKSKTDSNFVVDIAGGSESSVNLWTGDGSRSQIWTKGRRGLEFHELVTRLSGRCTDLDGGVVTNGQNIRLWDCNGSNAQFWAHNYYTGQIHLQKDSDYCLSYSGASPSAGLNITLRECRLVPNDTWDIVDNQYVASGTGFVMQTANGNSGAQIDLRASVPSQINQLWKLDQYVWGDLKADNGTADGLCVDAKGGGTPYNGQWIIGYTCHGGDNQKYAFDPVTKQWHNKANPSICLSYQWDTSPSSDDFMILHDCTDSRAYFDYVDGALLAPSRAGRAAQVISLSSGSSNYIPLETTDGGVDQTWAWQSE